MSVELQDHLAFCLISGLIIFSGVLVLGLLWEASMWIKRKLKNE